jgi:uncharacterized protein DUF3866
MPRYVVGTVTKILETGEGIVRMLVDARGKERSAVALKAGGADAETGAAGGFSAGDRVVVNTTAIDLDLGTGGDDFVLWNLAWDGFEDMGDGHILKMRYTPWQFDTLSIEEPRSTYHPELADATSIGAMPVVVCGLHSQIAPVVAVLQSREPGLNVAYVMTDGGGLPLAHSRLVAGLLQRDLLGTTITCGHAFGGLMEAVNVYSALMAAHIAEMDIAVVSIGPGIVGTETALGHTGMHQADAISAAGMLGGRPVAALRVSFAEKRARHRIVSHQSLTALQFTGWAPATVAVPGLRDGRTESIRQLLDFSGISERHAVKVVDASETAQALKSFDLQPTTMGRGFDDDPAFFEAAGAAAIVALGLVGE